MLVLTRKKDQTIVIAGPCEIKVLRLGDGKVRIGVYADKQTRVLRGELQEKPAAA